MKKLLSLVLAFLLCAAVFVSCGNTETPETADTSAQTETEKKKEHARVLTLMGPTGMGMAKLISDSKAGSTALDYEFTVAGTPDEITGDIIQGNFEFASVPTNLAATLNAKTDGAVSVVAVNTLGVLYVLENGNTINSIEDLNGKTIYSSGQGAIPEYALNYILDTFGIKCDVIYESEHDMVVTDLVSHKASVAILPEPKVTAALNTASALQSSEPAEDYKLRIALDLNDLWVKACEKNGDTSALYMGCVIVNNGWAEEHPDSLSAFLEEYKESVDFVNTDNSAPQLIVDAGIIPTVPVAGAALPNSHIVFITGDEMYLNLKGFYQVLFDFNPKSIGGKLPEDTFYRTENSYVIVD